MQVGIGAGINGRGGNLLLLDNFTRANTSAGTIGAPWTLRAPFAGSFPLPISSFGQIIDNAFVVPGGQIVYAFTTLTQTPQSVEVDFSWIDDGAGTQFTTLAVILSNTVNGIDNMLHITLVNSVCFIQKRVAGGAFITMNAVTNITPSLALGGAKHTIKVDLNGSTVRVRIDDTRFDQSVTDAQIPSIVGTTFIVEHYSATTDVRWPMKITRVLATR